MRTKPREYAGIPLRDIRLIAAAVDLNPTTVIRHLSGRRIHSANAALIDAAIETLQPKDRQDA